MRLWQINASRTKCGRSLRRRKGVRNLFQSSSRTFDVEDSGGELAEEYVSILVQDNECGAIGFAGIDFNEDCDVGLADFVSFYAEWTLCTEPYEDDCDMAWNLLVE